jgi:CheY-like chemotaxis protein
VALRVLVVDDDADLRKIMREFLERNGYEVYEAQNGAEAVEICEKLKPQFVLMDIAMPEMDGIEATSRILQKAPDTVVIGVTVYAKEKGSLLVHAGAKTILEKPLFIREIIQTIEKFIQEKSPETEQ